MYNASLQNYSYNRNRSLAVSFVINFILFFLFLVSTGSLFGSIMENEKKDHLVSIKSYNVITQSAPQQNPAPETVPANEIVEPAKTKTETPKPIAKKNISKKTQPKIPPKQDIKQTTNVSNPKIQKSNAQPSTQSNNSDIVTDATHFGMQNTPPDYPVISFQNNEKGSVTIEYIVSSDGFIKEAKILESSGFPRLDRTALASFKKWKFKAAVTVTGAVADSLPKKITFVFDVQTQTIKEE
jgi:TonB family protein